jgi:hypothetical protein
MIPYWSNDGHDRPDGFLSKVQKGGPVGDAITDRIAQWISHTSIKLKWSESTRFRLRNIELCCQASRGTRYDRPKGDHASFQGGPDRFVSFRRTTKYLPFHRTNSGHRGCK